METMFDYLRAKVEAEVSHPAVVAITSATNEDGCDVAARALAASLAAAGYSTLLIDTRSEIIGTHGPVDAVPLDEFGRREIPAEPTSRLAVLSISQSVQRPTNQRHTRAAFDLFREKFDYTIISAGFRGSSNPFYANVVSAANAVLVCVKIDRRQTHNDTRLAADLDRLGPRFLGLISITQSIIDTPASVHPYKAASRTEFWRAPMPPVEKSNGHREAAEWQT